MAIFEEIKSMSQQVVLQMSYPQIRDLVREERKQDEERLKMFKREEYKKENERLEEISNTKLLEEKKNNFFKRYPNVPDQKSYFENFRKENTWLPPGEVGENIAISAWGGN